MTLNQSSGVKFMSSQHVANDSLFSIPEEEFGISSNESAFTLSDKEYDGPGETNYKGKFAIIYSRNG